MLFKPTFINANETRNLIITVSLYLNTIVLYITGQSPIPSTQITGELTDCGDEGGVKRVLAESEQQTCLSHSTVSY